MNLILKEIHEIAVLLKTTPDKIHFGDKVIQKNKNYYKIKNPIFYKNNIFIYKKDKKVFSKNNFLNFFKMEFLNIKYPFPIKRRQLKKINILDVFKLNLVRKYNLKRNSYLFVLNKPHSNNYWHSLVDNFSDLINVIKNFEKIDVLCNVDSLSNQNYNYLIFLKKKLNFNIINISKKNFYFFGNIILTDTGIEHKLELENNVFLANKINNKAANEAREIFGAHKIESIYKTDKFGYDYGIIPHGYKVHIKNNIITMKNYSIPYVYPLRYSIFESFKYLKTKVNLTGKKYDRIYIYRKSIGSKQRLIANYNEIYALLIKYNFKFITFDEFEFEDQIKLANDCKILIGMHGSGLTNMIFMKPGSQIVDIIPFYYSLPQTDEFKIAALMCGHDYHRMYTENKINEKKNFEVDKEKLEKIIKKLIV